MKKLGVLLVSTLFSCVVLADTKISDLHTAATLDGTETLPIVQPGGCSTNGGTCKTTTGAIAKASALTGDCTKAVGSTSITCTKTSGVVIKPTFATLAVGANVTISNPTSANQTVYVTGSAGTVLSTITTNVKLPATPVDQGILWVSFDAAQVPAFILNTGQGFAEGAPPNLLMQPGSAIRFYYDGSGVRGSAAQWYWDIMTSADGGTYSSTGVYLTDTLAGHVQTLEGEVTSLLGTTGDITISAGTGTATFDTGANIPKKDGDETYSGSNTFSGNNTFSGVNTLSGNNTFTGQNTFEDITTLSAPEGHIHLIDTAQSGTNISNWDINLQSGTNGKLCISARKDDWTGGTDAICFTRGASGSSTGQGITNITFGNTTSNTSFTFHGFTSTFDGNVKGAELIPTSACSGVTGQGGVCQPALHQVALFTDTGLMGLYVDGLQNTNIVNQIVSYFTPGQSTYPSISVTGGCTGCPTDTTNTALAGVAVTSGNATIVNTGTSGLLYGESVVLSGTLPTGLSANTLYYVNNIAGLDATHFQLTSTAPTVLAGVTFTNGSATITNTGTNGLAAGNAVYLEGAIPTGFSANTLYYVTNINSVLSATQFQLSASSGTSGAAITPTSTTTLTVVGVNTSSSITPTSSTSSNATVVTHVSGNYLHSGGPMTGWFVMPAATYSGATTVKLTFATANPTGYSVSGVDETAVSQLTQTGHGQLFGSYVKATATASGNIWKYHVDGG